MSFWRPAVQRLSERMQENPHYPFIEVASDLYYLSVLPSMFYYLVIVQCGNVFIGAIILAYGQDNQITTVCGIVFCCLCIFIWWYKHPRVYVLNHRHRHYRFYIGDHLVIQGPYHNIYIRLRGEEIEGDKANSYAYVEFGGRDVEFLLLSGISSNVSAMRKQAMLIAERLSLNYFDMKDVSSLHVIRNRCKYRAKVIPSKTDLDSARSVNCCTASENGHPGNPSRRRAGLSSGQVSP